MPKTKPPEDQTEEERAVAVHRADAALDRERELQLLREVLVDERVRDFLWRVLERSSMFSEPFHSNFGITGYNCGKAALGKWLLGEITEADYNAWLLMQQRHYQAELAKKAIELSQSAGDSGSA